MSDKIARQIVALLNKAESTPSEHERDALLEKATELRLKYVIEDADLRAHSQDKPKENIVVKQMLAEKHAAFIKAKRELLTGLAQLNNCKIVLVGNREYMEIMGFESDVNYVQFLYASLLLQMERAMARDESERPAYESLRTWRTSYAHAWERRVIMRLAEFKQRSESKAEASTPGTALVLQDRNKEVAERVTERYPRLRQGYKNTSTHSADGYTRGDAAGRQASLNRGIDRGSRGSISR